MNEKILKFTHSMFDKCRRYFTKMHPDCEKHPVLYTINKDTKEIIIYTKSLADLEYCFSNELLINSIKDSYNE